MAKSICATVKKPRHSALRILLFLGIVDSYGSIATLGANFFTPDGIAMGPGGKLYIANFGNSTVVELKAECQATNACEAQTVVADCSGNSLSNPAGLAVSAGGSLLGEPNAAIRPFPSSTRWTARRAT